MIKNLHLKDTAKRVKHRRPPLQDLTDHQFQQLIAEDLLQPRQEAVAALLRKVSELSSKS
ncbi:MAG: hypothetical protein QM743_08115 [Chitinophagaceae bacterium]|uniref:hypothetical protein n=1 Tax=Rurimicrobium arvi TaxID=2049916 RepID=UPI0031DDE8EF